MQRRRLIILLVGFVLLALVATAVWPRSPEPEYRGKKLSEWLLACGTSSNRPDEAEAPFAIRQIGTNALPWLIEWRNYQIPPWKTSLADTLERGPLAAPYTRAIARALARRQALASQTLIGYQILGRAAAPAVPQLRALLRDEPSSVWAMHALATIGEAGLPALIAALGDPRTAHRDNLPRCIVSMRRGGYDISSAVPALARSLGDTDAEVATAAAGSLAMAARPPRFNPSLRRPTAGLDRAVPALADSAKDPRVPVRYAAVRTLGAFSDQARPAVPALIEALNDADSTVRSAATNALERIAPEVLKTPGADK
ncbi:MAG: hypothetical protein QOJ40_1081 [Verrucomicrobiota bacterium]